MGFEEYKHLCNKGGNHEGRELVMLCLDEECQAKRLCCLVCVDELHRKHQLISLYKFQEMLEVLTKKGDNDAKGKVIEILVGFQAQVMQQLDQSLREFQKCVARNKDKLREVVGVAQQSVSMQFTTDDIEQLYRQIDNAAVCKYLGLIRDAEGQALKDAESAEKTLKNAHQFLDKTLVDTDKMCLRGMEDVNSALTKLKKLLDSQGKNYKQLLFSKELKCVSIEVSADQKTAKRFEGAGAYPVVMLEHPLTEFNNSFTVTLKEQPGNKGCWLGVCVLDIVKTLNFKSCYGIGKGTWGIDQVGATHQSAYSWSHHDTAFNSQPKVGWSFVTGDTLTVKADFQSKMVIFSKGQQTYQMPIQTHLGDIYGYVGCTHIGDIWQIS